MMCMRAQHAFVFKDGYLLSSSHEVCVGWGVGWGGNANVGGVCPPQCHNLTLLSGALNVAALPLPALQ